MSDETGWLLEGEVKDGQQLYIGVVNGFLNWTPDPNKALRLCRRADAEALCEIVEDCWRVVEHMWCDSRQPDEGESEEKKS